MRFQSTKLTAENVKEIRRILRAGRKLARQRGRKNLPRGMILRLSEKFGVTVRAVHFIAKGERWKRQPGKPGRPKRTTT